MIFLDMRKDEANSTNDEYHSKLRGNSLKARDEKWKNSYLEMLGRIYR